MLDDEREELNEADDIFTKLTGDVVEPRRYVTEDNSLSANVDAGGRRWAE